MHINEEYIDLNIKRLEEMIKENTISKDKSNNFIFFEDLEDDYTHNEIEHMQYLFKDKVETYLKTYYPNEFVVWCDWCVHVATRNFCIEKGIKIR